MKGQKRGGGNGETNVKNLSDKELEVLVKHAKLYVIEAELDSRWRKLILAHAMGELDFRRSGKTRPVSPEELDKIWIQAVSEIAKAHGFTLEDVWEIAERVVAKFMKKFDEKMKRR